MKHFSMFEMFEMCGLVFCFLHPRISTMQVPNPFLHVIFTFNFANNSLIYFSPIFLKSFEDM